MNRYIKYVALLLAVAFVGCADEVEESFIGVDNYITSFSLTTDDATFKAQIVESEITVVLPSNVDLTDATVAYTLSENAVIVPDPATITDWNSEQLFRVEAYNGGYASYKYSLSRSNIVTSEDVELFTQSDVDAFAASGVNEIEGNLYLGGIGISDDEKITSIAGLVNVNKIGENLVIGLSFCDDSFDGLKNLESVGSIVLGSESTHGSSGVRFNLELPNLQTVSNVIINSDSLCTLSLPLVKEIGNLHINSLCLEEFNADNLESAKGNLNIWGTRSSSQNMKLYTLELPMLKSVLGGVSIMDFAYVTTFDISQIQSVGGDFLIDYVGGIAALDLSKLSSCAAFTVINISSLMTLNTSSLESATDITLTSLTSIVSADFSGISTIDNLTVTYYPTDFTIKTPEIITGNVSLRPTDTTVDVLALEGTKSIGGKLTLTYYKGTNITIKEVEHIGEMALTSCTPIIMEFTNLKTIGSFTVSSLTVLTDFSMPVLESVGTFSLTSFTKLERFSAPMLERMESCLFKACYLMTDVDLQSLTTIDGEFAYWGAAYSSSTYLAYCTVTDFAGFESLTSVGSVVIKNANSLVDFTALQNLIPSIESDGWSVTSCGYNPTYDDMVAGNYTDPAKSEE